MSQIVTKFITDNAVTDLKARLRNNNYLRARNAADSADVDILKVDASDIIQFASLPRSSATPSNANELVNKSNVDGVAGGTSLYKQACVAVAVSNINLSSTSSPLPIDSIVVANGDRVLLAGQTTASQNGIYVATTATNPTTWVRASDADTSGEVKSGMAVYVNQGSLYGQTLWILDTADPITLGTTGLSFVKKTAQGMKENLTLDSTDISNQYKDLGFLAMPNSITLFVSGVMQVESVDYDVTTSGGVSRIEFLSDLATGGNAALVSGDVINVQYFR